MSDFTDAEDRQLVQLALAFLRHGRHILWDQLKKRMKGTKKPKEALRQRLKTLKRTYGPDLKDFPEWFFKVKFTTEINPANSALRGERVLVSRLPLANKIDRCCGRAELATSSVSTQATRLRPRRGPSEGRHKEEESGTPSDGITIPEEVLCDVEGGVVRFFTATAGICSELLGSREGDGGRPMRSSLSRQPLCIFLCIGV